MLFTYRHYQFSGHFLNLFNSEEQGCLLLFDSISGLSYEKRGEPSSSQFCISFFTNQKDVGTFLLELSSVQEIKNFLSEFQAQVSGKIPFPSRSHSQNIQNHEMLMATFNREVFSNDQAPSPKISIDKKREDGEIPPHIFDLT